MAASLGARTRHGLQWSLLGVVFNLALQLGVGAALARMLGPATFGLMAMATVGLRFVSYFSQIGLSVSLAAVQRVEVSEDDVRFALGVTSLAGTAASLIAWFAAPAASAYFHHPEAGELMRVLAVSLLMQSLAAVPIALLRRRMQFRKLAILENLSYAVGYGTTGLVAAWMDWGVWALVAATLGQQVLLLIGSWLLARPPMRPNLDMRGRRLMGYGIRHTAVSLLEFLYATLDYMLIGRLLGERSLGLYDRSFNLVNQPMERAAGILTRVLFPLFATIQGDRARVGSVFQLGVAVIGVFGVVICTSISAAAGPVVGVLLGHAWYDAVPVVRWLALVIPLLFMSVIAGVLCDALAWLSFKLRVQSVCLLLVCAGMLSMARWGLQGIILALLIAEGIRLGVYFTLVSRRLACSLRDASRTLLVVALSAGQAYGLVALACRLSIALALWQQLLAAAVAGGLALIVGALLLVRLLAHTGAGRLAAEQLAPWAWAARRFGPMAETAPLAP